MAVIAVTSGIETGVKYVAEHVARRLGLELVHREIGEAGRAVAPNTHHTLHESHRSRWDAGLDWLNAARDMVGLDELESVCRLAQRSCIF